MNNSLTVAEFLTRLREHADIDDLTVRHPDAQLIRMFNLAWRQLRTRLSNAGFSYFLEATDAAALPTSAAETGEQYLEVDFPAGAAGVYGLDINIGSRWLPLRQGSFAERRDYQNRFAQGRLNKAPEVFVVRTVPQEDTTSLVAGKVMLFPLNTSGHDYRLWYLPVWPEIDVANTTYVVYGHDIWFDWAILDVAIRVHIRDNDSAGVLGAEQQRQADVWREIVKSARDMESAGPVRMRRRGSRARYR